MKFFISAALFLLTILAGSGGASAEEMTGRLVGIDDAGYPFYNITIEYEADRAKDFTVNAEELGLGGSISSLEGETVTVRYSSSAENALMDIEFSGASLLGSDAPEHASDWRQVTGVLRGADTASGDEPSRISVGNMAFDFFVTDDIANVNGETVTAYYERRQSDNVTSLERE